MADYYHRTRAEKINRLAFGLMELHEDDLKKVYEQVASVLNDYKKNQMVESIYKVMMTDEERCLFLKVDGWMDKRFSDDITRSPKMVAYACKKALKLNGNVMFMLVPLARKIKKRVKIRKRRQQVAEIEAALNN